MKKLKRNRVTAAGIVAGAMIASSGILTGCNESVYGPPPGIYDDLKSSEDISVSQDSSEILSVSQDSSFLPGDNELEDVYGPPSSFDAEENLPEVVYGPPEDYYDGEQPVSPQKDSD